MPLQCGQLFGGRRLAVVRWLKRHKCRVPFAKLPSLKCIVLAQRGFENKALLFLLVVVLVLECSAKSGTRTRTS